MHTPARLRTLWVFACLMLSIANSAHAEWPHSPIAPRPMYPAGGDVQQVSAALPDGSGGAYLVVLDTPPAGGKLVAVHMLASGDLDPTWGPGLLLQDLGNGPTDVNAVLDGRGGFYVAWRDNRSGTLRNYFTHVLGQGLLEAGFSTNGLPFSAVNLAQDPVSLTVDPSGALFAAWPFEFSPTDRDIVVSKFSVNGVLLAASTVVGTGLNETKPEIIVDPDPAYNSVDVVFLQNGATILKAHDRNSLAGGTSLTVGSASDPSTQPQLTHDGNGSLIVLYTEFIVGQPALAMRTLRDGVVTYSSGTFSGAQPGIISLSDAVYSGEGQSVFSYRWSGALESHMRLLGRLGTSPPATIPAPGVKTSNLAVADGSGGGILLAGENVTAGVRIQATKRDVFNVQPAFWLNSLTAMQTNSLTVLTAACSDGNGGVYVFGVEGNGPVRRAMGMHLDRWGTLDAAPVITSVKDVAADQGGFVRVSWKASYQDDAARAQIGSYRVWRQVPQGALAAMRARPLYDPTDAAEPAPGTIWQPTTGPAATAGYSWEFVTSTPAAQFPSYSATVATSGDSSSAGAAKAYFMIESRANSYPVGWASLPDSGHSVDNLPPATPAPFAGAVVGGASTQLTWGPNTESDLAGYELYRGASAGFVPNALNRIATPSLNNYFDSSVGQFYKLAAIDTHGNRSGYALLTPTGVLDAGDTAPRELSFTLASANPAMGGASLRYALPSAGRVRVQLLDVNGRIVRTLLDADMAAGTYTARWDGRDATGARSAAGMYFARLTAGERTITRRIVLAE